MPHKPMPRELTIRSDSAYERSHRTDRIHEFTIGYDPVDKAIIKVLFLNNF